MIVASAKYAIWMKIRYAITVAAVWEMPIIAGWRSPKSSSRGNSKINTGPNRKNDVSRLYEW
jgi:hypothetical protein